jgi:deoxycytidylate deaminase
MSQFLNIIPTLIEVASTSTIKNQLAAVLIKGRKMISRPSSNTSRNSCRGQTCGSLHAEAHAILDVYGQELSYTPSKGWVCSSLKGKPLDLIVIRVKNDNTLGNARPCYNCHEMMKAVKIKRIYYTNNDGKIICEFVKDMVSIHASSVAHHIHTLKKGFKNETLTTYFQNLLKIYFPTQIKKINFTNFINNDLVNNLPDHTYIVKNEGGYKIVYIFDSENNIIVSSKLL